MELRTDEIEYAGAIIRAWKGRDNWWNVSVRWVGSGPPRRPKSLTAWTHSYDQTIAWSDGRDLVEQVYWPNAGSHRQEEG